MRLQEHLLDHVRGIDPVLERRARECPRHEPHIVVILRQQLPERLFIARASALQKVFRRPDRVQHEDNPALA